MGITFQVFVENSLMVDFVHPYPPGSMDDPVLFPNDSDMSDRSGLVSDESQATGHRFFEEGIILSERHLLRSIPRQIDSRHPVNNLGKPRTIDPIG